MYVTSATDRGKTNVLLYYGILYLYIKYFNSFIKKQLHFFPP